jgi:hypothetical protein
MGQTVRNAEPYLGCRYRERSKMLMEFSCIKDVDILLQQIAGIKIE